MDIHRRQRTVADICTLAFAFCTGYISEFLHRTAPSQWHNEQDPDLD